MREVASAQERIRRGNLAAVLKHVHLQGSATRAILADRLHLNRSTILTLTGELTQAGLVREETPRRRASRAGRPSFVVLPGSGAYVLAFDLRPDGLSAARVALGGRVLERREVAIDSRAEATAWQIVRVGSALVREASRGSVCVGAGVSVPPPARAVAGAGAAARENLLGAVRAARRAEPYRNRPFLIGHDVNLAVTAEHRRGAGIGRQNLIYLQSRDGLRGGVVIGGAPIGGDEGYGVDLGHLIVTPDGHACRCGSRGCLEAELGRGDGTSARRVLEAGLAKLRVLFAPELIVFGGSLRALNTPPAGRCHGIQLVNAALGDDAILVGTAELAFSALLADPIGVIDNLP
ncbi:ROK family transcriptional regulator [Nonomuraea typhae]|uniref:ROK family transcriptional regulator n=1 Tax=Nonomuraea typhae TaxID=2603600 RepID=UPI0012F9D804|nr:ROK family transcriptional regulator [Nonomuraea typhae]